jgi:(p)ppGpp synthase/HD superfamily hydrolase
VHLQDCLKALQADVYDWLIRLSWQDEISAKFPVGIEVNVYHRTGLLSDISVIFMRENTNLLTIQMLSDNRKNTVILNMFTEVTTLSHFLMTSESVKQLSDVVCVERTIRL